MREAMQDRGHNQHTGLPSSNRGHGKQDVPVADIGRTATWDRNSDSGRGP